MLQRIALLTLIIACAVMAQPKKIVMVRVAPERVAELRAVAPEANIVAPPAEDVAREVEDADAVIGRLDPALIPRAKKLQWLQVFSAGVERYLHLGGPALRDSDIVLTNGKIIQAPEIADHAFAMLLGLTRQLPVFLENKARGQWIRGSNEGLTELRGRTALVVGVGGIGTEVAVRAKAFGMEVIGVEPKDLPLAPYLDRVVLPDRIDVVLPEADVIFLCAPHTPESHKMLGPGQFELMKRGAYFVAVSRGALYDMDALVRALDSKRLSGAGVDVTDPEPLPTGHALWEFPNVIITPHIAGRSDREWGRRMDLYKENLRRFLDGKPLRNVVDKQKGY